MQQLELVKVSSYGLNRVLLSHVNSWSCNLVSLFNGELWLTFQIIHWMTPGSKSLAYCPCSWKFTIGSENDTWASICWVNTMKCGLRTNSSQAFKPFTIRRVTFTLSVIFLWLVSSVSVTHTFPSTREMWSISLCSNRAWSEQHWPLFISTINENL